jgi:hypothetical protein
LWRRSFVGFLARLLQRQQSMIQPFSGLAEDLILSVLAGRGRKRLGVRTANVRRCRSKVRPLTRSEDFDATADRQLSNGPYVDGPLASVFLFRR